MISSWRTIVGYEGVYQVSDLGEVRGLDRHDSLNKKIRGRVLKQSLAGNYLAVTLCRHGQPNQVYVHQLVAEAFCGARPTGMVACHGNGNARDNRAANLRWATPKQNSADAMAHGTLSKGAAHYASKITGICDDRVRDMVRCGVRQKDIASYFGVSKSTICRVAS